MANVPNSSLVQYADGTVVTGAMLNQTSQVLQAAVNDNQSQITSIKNAQQTLLVATGAAYPGNPSNGQLFYRTDLTQMKMYNGSSWVDTESVVATSQGISLNGVTYVAATASNANTVALRDANGGLSAVNGTFTGQLSSAKNTQDDGSGNETVSGNSHVKGNATVDGTLTVNGQQITHNGGISINSPGYWVG